MYKLSKKGFNLYPIWLRGHQKLSYESLSGLLTTRGTSQVLESTPITPRWIHGQRSNPEICRIPSDKRIPFVFLVRLLSVYQRRKVLSVSSKNNFKIYVSCVKTVGVYVCKFGICGTKFQRKPLKKNKNKNSV